MPELDMGEVNNHLLTEMDRQIGSIATSSPILGLEHVAILEKLAGIYVSLVLSNSQHLQDQKNL